MNLGIVFIISYIFFLPSVVLAYDLETIATSVKNVVNLVGSSILIIMAIWVAILYFTSSGDPERMNKAKNALIYLIIGVVIYSLAMFIEDIVKNMLFGPVQ